MNSFKDFYKTLDADFFHDVELELHSNSLLENSPTEEMKRHCEISIISSLILMRYHEWLSEQLS